MMHYRRFGRTELAMPVFSCGGMRYQQAWKDLQPEEIEAAGQANLESTIERALAEGITHIETARGYGSSEMQLGRILPRLDRDRLIVQTKVGPCEDAAEFAATVEKSLGLLGLETVDLLAMHGINTPELLDWTIRPGGCLEVARRLQREGRVRFVGFSTHGPRHVIEAAIATGEFDYVNLHWYWVNQRNWSAVEAAAVQDMGVFIISPSDKGGMLYDPPEKMRELCAPLDPMAFNDLFCLLRPEVHTLSIGAARPSDFTVHVDSLKKWDQAASLVGEIEGRLVAAMDAVVGAGWRDRWQSIPEPEDLPGEVNVREILQWADLSRGLGLTAFARSRYNILGEGGHWVPGQSAGDFDEAAVRVALADHPLVDQIPGLLRDAHAILHESPKRRLSETD